MECTSYTAPWFLYDWLQMGWTHTHTYIYMLLLLLYLYIHLHMYVCIYIHSLPRILNFPFYIYNPPSPLYLSQTIKKSEKSIEEERLLWSKMCACSSWSNLHLNTCLYRLQFQSHALWGKKFRRDARWTERALWAATEMAWPIQTISH